MREIIRLIERRLKGRLLEIVTNAWRGAASAD